jgi:hypothetical protein
MRKIGFKLELPIAEAADQILVRYPRFGGQYLLFPFRLAGKASLLSIQKTNVASLPLEIRLFWSDLQAQAPVTIRKPTMRANPNATHPKIAPEYIIWGLDPRKE